MRRFAHSLARRLAEAPSTRGWAIRFAVANLLAVFLTTVLVTLFIDSTTLLSRVLLLAGAIAVAFVGASLLAVATSVREARFPKHPDIVLAMTRELSHAMRQEGSRQAVFSREGVKRAAIEDLKTYLRALEDVLSDAWSKRRFGEQTNVEVVVMNRGGGGFVTVAAWATNRPLSLEKRDANPAFYEQTEAAVLYRTYGDCGTRAPIHIIPDVSKHAGYDHFGRDPRIRTNSTALFPIYDTDSRLHGFVAITARQRTDLFREEDRKFWTEAWDLWEPHLLRQILRFESASGGAAISESA